jgi:hypothetical protein
MGRKAEATEIEAIDLLPNSEEGALASAIDHGGIGHYYVKAADGWRVITHAEYWRRTMDKYAKDVFRG